METKDRAFLKLRARLADELLPLSEVGHVKASWTPDFPS